MELSTLINLLLSQYVAYILVNFILIPSYYLQATNSNNKGFYQKISLKAGVLFVLSLILSGSFNFIGYASIISASHLLLSIYFERQNKTSRFIIHQILHLLIITFLVFFYKNAFSYFDHLNLLSLIKQDNKLLLYVISYTLCLGPANVLIRALVKNYDIMEGDNIKDAGLLRAGRFIGNIERIVTLSLLLTSHFETIGFLIAAKSLLRIKDNNKKESEYILVGTLLSFGIAILIGLLVQYGVNIL